MGSVKYIFIMGLFCSAVNCYKEQNYKLISRSAFDQNLYENVLDSELCGQQLAFLKNHSLGLQFLDASAKLPSGFLTGNWNDLGDYFQCLRIDRVIDSMHFQGKYCALTVPIQQDPIQIPELPQWPEWPEWPEISWPQPDNETVMAARNFEILQNYAQHIAGVAQPVDTRIFPIVIAAGARMTLSICIPRVCTSKEAIDFLQEQIPFVNVEYNEYFCRLPDDKPFVAVDYVAIGLLTFVGFLLIASTSYDLYHTFWLETDSSRVNVLFRSFSVYTNTRRFLTFNSSPNALECVDGIRAISMMWVIVGHTYSMTMLGFIHNVNDIVTWLTSFTSTWINSAPITVDTFFVLSGILAVYTTIGKISKDRYIRSIHMFYINRLLRIFPLLATTVLLQASLFNHLSDGPVWLNVAHAAENCRTYWWAALLHIQNYVNPLEICLVHTWYLSVDTQVYLVSLLLMVLLFGQKRLAWCALAGFMLISLVSASVISFMYNFSAALANLSRFMEFTDYVQTYYINTLTRAPPFVVGMMYGYLLHLFRGRTIRISYVNVILLWILSFAMMAFCIFSMYPVMQLDHDGQFFDNFLNAYMRSIWATSLGWLIFACVHGYGGPINWFLSLQMWKLPARLSFAMYLLHLPIIMVANGSWVKTYYFTDGNNVYRFMSDVSVTALAAFILSIAVDAPCSTLQKLLLGGGGKRSQPQKIEPREEVFKTSL